MTFLVTNDDGITARGISTLVEILSAFGRVVVVAPDGPRSGQSAALTVEVPLRLNKVSEEGNILRYSCSGTPVDCVKLGIQEVLQGKSPDYIFSGINHGSNSSINIHYSGTMGAAIEGAIRGIPSIGISLCDHSPEANFSFSKEPLHRIIKEIIFNTVFPKGTCLNINIPNRQVFEGVRICRQSYSYWVEEYDKRVQLHGRPYFWLTGKMISEEIDDSQTDEYAIHNGYISIVPCKIDLTDYDFLHQINSVLNN